MKGRAKTRYGTKMGVGRGRFAHTRDRSQDGTPIHLRLSRTNDPIKYLFPATDKYPPTSLVSRAAGPRLTHPLGLSPSPRHGKAWASPGLLDADAEVEAIISRHESSSGRMNLEALNATPRLTPQNSSSIGTNYIPSHMGRAKRHWRSISRLVGRWRRGCMPP